MHVSGLRGGRRCLPKADGPTDIAVVPLAYELTTSYGTGACDGPQVASMPARRWNSLTTVWVRTFLQGMSLPPNRFGKERPPPCVANLTSSQPMPSPSTTGTSSRCFWEGSTASFRRLFTLLAIIPPWQDLTRLTLVQLDAHADLRSSLDGEIFFTCLCGFTKSRCWGRDALAGWHSSLQQGRIGAH